MKAAIRQVMKRWASEPDKQPLRRERDETGGPDTPPDTPPGPSDGITSSQRSILATCVLVMLAVSFSPPLLNMFAPQIWYALSLTEAQWSVFLAARGLFLIVFVLLAGLAGDLFGARRILLLSLLAYLACTVLTVTTSSPLLFIVATSLLTIVGVGVRILNVTLLLIAFDGQKRVFVLLFYSALYLLVFLLSPLVVERIAVNIGGRWAYLPPLGLSVAALALATRYLPPLLAPRAKTGDVLAVSLWAWGVCAVIFALMMAAVLGWANPIVLSALTLGALILLGLNWFERRALGEKWKLRLRHKRQLAVVVLAGIIVNLALYSVAVQSYRFFERIQNLDAVAAAIRLTPILVGALLLGGVATRLNVQLGAGRALSLGLLVAAIATAGYVFIRPDSAYWVVALLLVVMGFGFTLANVPRLLLLNASVPLGLVVTGQAIGSATAQLGGALGNTLTLTLIEYFGLRALGDLTGLDELGGDIVNQLRNLITPGRDIPALMPSGAGSQLAEELIAALHQAYSAGLSRAMLALAAICLLTAVVVQIALSNGKEQKKTVG